MFFVRRHGAVVLTREGEIGHIGPSVLAHVTLQFLSPSRPEICYARLERALPETNRGWVAKFAAPVYRATGQRQTINLRGHAFGREVVTPQSHRSSR